MTSSDKKLGYALFVLRLGVFIVMIMWTIDKFINPDHTAAVFKTFYMIDNLSAVASYGVGVVQLVLVTGFLLGLYKKWTYAAVMIMHGVSTLSSWERYLDPWNSPNILFYAAFPMLSALIALYILRDRDEFLTFHSLKSSL